MLNLNVCVIGIDLLSVLNTPKALAGVQRLRLLTNSCCWSSFHALKRTGGENEKLEIRGHCRGHISIARQNAYFFPLENMVEKQLIWNKISNGETNYVNQAG